MAGNNSKSWVGKQFDALSNAGLSFGKNFLYKTPLRFLGNVKNTLVNSLSGGFKFLKGTTSDIAGTLLDTAGHFVNPIVPKLIAEPISKLYGKSPWGQRPK